jgi:uncharacterized membrane protein
VRSPLANNDIVLAAVGFAFIMGMAWLFQTIFSGRGALLHTGALMGTIMTGNVFLNIIPNQKRVIADLVAGRTPDPRFGRQAKTRSTHNNYLTLPVLFLMISGHYPLTFRSAHAWIMVGLVLIAGAVVRHYYNERHLGRGDKWWAWGVAATCVVAAAFITMPADPLGRQIQGRATNTAGEASPTRVPKAVDDIIASRCSMCHAAEPVWSGLATPPKGMLLETDAQIARHAEAIRLYATLSDAMPPNNITQMTAEERQTLARWLAHR